MELAAQANQGRRQLSDVLAQIGKRGQSLLLHPGAVDTPFLALHAASM
jgi:hypothetical protein